MSTTLALMLQITATNGAAGVLNSLKKSLADAGRLSKDAAHHFDDMTRSLQRAGNSFATAFALKRTMQPGIKAAADLEESMLRVKGNIAQVEDKADDLAAKLKQVRDTGREVSKVMPFSAKEVVDIQGSLLKAGVDLNSVVGSRGAAYAAAGLATISGVAPGEVGDLLARVGKQYDFKPEDYKPAADLLMKGEAASPGSLQELLYSLKQSGATSKLLGVSFKDSVTMAAAMAPLGLEAGTAINRYILDSSGLTKHQRESMVKLGLARMHDGKFENLLYKNGKYIGLEAENAMVREKFAGIQNDQVKMKLAHDIWGQEGMRAALMVGAGQDIFGDMAKQMQESLGLEERMKIVMDGFNSSAKAAAGTVQTMLATAFDPALAKATKLANIVNDLADSAAKGMDTHPTVTNLLAAGGTALTVGAAGYGVWNLLQGARSGLRMLKGAGAPGGIAGKMAAGAAGGTHVFVTNWPSGMLGPGESLKQKLASRTGDALGTAGAAAGGTSLAKRYGLRALGVSAGLAIAPLAAIYGASEWAGETSHDQERVGGIHGAFSDPLKRFLGMFGFDKDREIEERRRKNRDELDGGGQTINIQIDGRTVASVVNDHNARQAKRN